MVRLSKRKSDWLVNEYLNNPVYRSNLVFILNEHFGTMDDKDLRERYNEARK